MARARATATRWRIPPDSSCGRLRRAWASLTIPRNFSIQARFCAADQSRYTWSTARWMFSNAESQGNSE